jgi:hypothetical protein
MVWVLLSRPAASLVAKFPDNMWAGMVFKMCFRLTALDLILKSSSSLAVSRA